MINKITTMMKLMRLANILVYFRKKKRRELTISFPLTNNGGTRKCNPIVLVSSFVSVSLITSYFMMSNGFACEQNINIEIIVAGILYSKFLYDNFMVLRYCNRIQFYRVQ